METALISIFICLWPRTLNHISRDRRFRLAIMISVFTVSTRPTSAISFVLFYMYLFHDASIALLKGDSKPLSRVFFDILIYACLTMAVTVCMDSYFYGRLVFVPWRFLDFNISQGISSFYGVHSWHWYLTQAFPIVLLTYLPFFVAGLYNYGTRYPRLAHAILIPVSILSVLHHKEFRFLSVALPFIYLFVAFGLRDIWLSGKWRALVYICVAAQLMFGVYMGTVHQRGVSDTISWMSAHMKPNTSILFAMPCHSTPFHSHLHGRQFVLDFISCEPPIGVAEPGTYLDESDKFYASPIEYLSRTRNDLSDVDVFVCFEEILNRTDRNFMASVRDYIEQRQFNLSKTFFNSHLHDDSRRSGRIFVFEKTT